MQCLVKRYQNFKDDISEHLDNILERRQQIDTSFIQINDEFISDRKVVKEYFLNYYRYNGKDHVRMLTSEERRGVGKSALGTICLKNCP